MRAVTVTQGAMLASVASHLLLFGLLTTKPLPVIKNADHELIPVRLFSPVQEKVQKREVKKTPVTPLPRPPVDNKNQVQNRPLAALQLKTPSASTVPQAIIPAPVRPVLPSDTVRPVAQVSQHDQVRHVNTAASQPIAMPRDTVPAKPTAPTPSPRRNEYLALVRSMVERNKEYPSFARQTGQQGTVLVRVIIGENGAAESVTLEHSSGYQHLDRAALAAVKSAAPFKPPYSYGLQSISIEIPITYKLN